MDNIGELNIYTNGAGIMTQKGTDSENLEKPSVDIHTNRDINITADKEGIIIATLNNNPGAAAANIQADGAINISAATRNGILITDYGASYKGNGDKNLVITANNDVNISGSSNDERYAIYMTRVANDNPESQDAFFITSNNGDVNLSGARGVGIDPGEGANNTGMEGSIIGKNVTISALGNSADANAVTATAGKLSIQSNQNGGIITLQTNGGVVVDVSGQNTQLILGDGATNTDVYVDGYMKVTDGATATFEENTTTHVDSTYLTTENKNFITTNGNGTVNLNGKLDIGNVETGTELNFSDSEALNQVAAEAIQTNNVLQDIKLDDKGTMSVGTVSSEEAHKVLAGSLLTDVALYATENNVDGVTTLLTGENDVEALNSAAGLSAMAGVEHGTYTAAGIFNDAVAGHLMNRNDEDVWAYGFHNKENVNGLSFGADYDAQYNGVVAGADLYRNGGTVAGIALSYADGNVSGSNGFASTRNDADYYGASLYARFDRGSYALLGDISYMKGDHDVTQWNKGQQITASPDSDAVSVGVKAVKDFAAGGSGTLTPYIGVRYLRLSTDGFTTNNGLHYEGDDQDLVLIPVGVNYSAAITGGSWTFRPYAGVGYIWNAGDKSVDQTVTLGPEANSFSYDTVDSGSFLTRVGFVADHGDMSYGVGYSWQKGDSVSNNAWTLSASFRF